jgi:hypothetical protein
MTSKRMKWIDHVAGMRRGMHVRFQLEGHKILLANPGYKRILENNFRIEVRDIGWSGIEWIHLIQD